MWLVWKEIARGSIASVNRGGASLSSTTVNRKSGLMLLFLQTPQDINVCLTQKDKNLSPNQLFLKYRIKSPSKSNDLRSSLHESDKVSVMFISLLRLKKPMFFTKSVWMNDILSNLTERTLFRIAKTYLIIHVSAFKHSKNGPIHYNCKCLTINVGQ